MKIDKLKRITLLFLFSPFLNACATVNDKFDCPMKPGIHCESIDSVNARVSRGEIVNHGTSDTCSDVSERPIQYKHSAYFPHAKGEPVRFGETVMRVWVAPFEDKEGNYHQESNIYTITKPGAWIGMPLKAIDTRGN